MRARPLSPHLSVYRFMYTMALSIAHRITGVALSAGLLLLTWWLMAAAGDAVDYATVTAVLGSPLGRTLLAGWLFAYVYHLVNGIRHLTWDAGIGLERHEARRSAKLAIVATIVLYAVLAWLLFTTAAAAQGGAQ